MASEYLLNNKEAENIVDALKGDLSGGTLKEMFASSDRRKFAKDLLKKHIEKEVSKRKKITMPSQEEMQKSLREVLEEIEDKVENELDYEEDEISEEEGCFYS